jgi:hypothetical protein
MKLPKLPAQWEKLDSFAKDRIDEASDQAAMFLAFAGYNSPQDLDENGDEIGDDVQSLLMDAMLRAPFLFLHISKLNELTSKALDPALDADARISYRTWARDAAIADLHRQRLLQSRQLDDPTTWSEAHWKLLIINRELNLRSAGVARGEVVDWKARAAGLPEHQRDYASRIWGSRYGYEIDKGPRNPEEWERFYRIGNEMDGTVGRDKDGN